MLFNSSEFGVFLAAVLAIYYLLIPERRVRARRLFLVFASYFFYMSWSPLFGLLLLASTLLDYSVGLRLARAAVPWRRRALVALSLTGNLGLLGFFKYGTFLAENFRFVAVAFGASPSPHVFDIAVPIGISFYTFQSLSYSLDVYRRVQAPTKSLLDFALYVSFFPQLVAGPIVRSRVFLPQLAAQAKSSGPDVEYGLMRIGTGLIKKVVFADVLAGYVDPVFANPEGYTGLNLLLAVYAYAYQIYFDFSGYSDIAIGLGRLFGFRIPENFDRPYLAADPREFWRRWHISLSTWLRDYLYISLGGNRRSRGRTAVNLGVTMLLGGLWHGAAWNFLIWGAYHGVWLLIHRALAAAREPERPRLPLAVRRIATFHGVCLGWVVFRAESLPDVIAVLRGLGAWGYVATTEGGRALLILLVAVGLHTLTSRVGWRERFTRAPAWIQGVSYAAIGVLVFLFSPLTQRFIYFQF